DFDLRVLVGRPGGRARRGEGAQEGSRRRAEAHLDRAPGRLLGVADAEPIVAGQVDPGVAEPVAIAEVADGGITGLEHDVAQEAPCGAAAVPDGGTECALRLDAEGIEDDRWVSRANGAIGSSGARGTNRTRCTAQPASVASRHDDRRDPSTVSSAHTLTL